MVEQTSFPLTEPHGLPIFDTGPHPDPLTPVGFSRVEEFDTDAMMRPLGGYFHAEPIVVPPMTATALGADQVLKRWRLALVVGGVWVVAAAAGLGFYYWWYTSMNKTAAVFGVLMYLMLCAIGSVLTSMVPSKPQVTALAIALMSAPLASVAAAAVLHGSYYFEWIARPTIG